MATTTVPTTITPEALELAREYGVEREMHVILDKGREMVRGLRALDVESEGPHDMGDPLIVVTAVIDPNSAGDPSHQEWWSWRIEEFGVHKAAQFLVVITPDFGGYGR